MTATALSVLPANAPRSKWLAARRGGITATDVVKIVGLSPYGNALDVYLDKRTGLGEGDAPSEEALWGQLLEDQVARQWAARNHAKIRRVGLLAHRGLPHHMASCDRIVIGEGAPLELKTRNRWADDFEDGVPDRVGVQVQWQMHVTGSDHAHVAALIGGGRLVSHTVGRDQVLIDFLVEEADQVWRAVQTGEPPTLQPWQMTGASLRRAHPDRTGEIEVDPDTAGPLLAAYRGAAAAEKQARADKELAKVQLIALLGDAEQGLVNGQPAYVCRHGGPETTIPAERVRALLADHPDLATPYAITKPGPTRFTLKGR